MHVVLAIFVCVVCDALQSTQCRLGLVTLRYHPLEHRAIVAACGDNMIILTRPTTVRYVRGVPKICVRTTPGGCTWVIEQLETPKLVCCYDQVAFM